MKVSYVVESLLCCQYLSRTQQQQQWAVTVDKRLTGLSVNSKVGGWIPHRGGGFFCYVLAELVYHHNHHHSKAATEDKRNPLCALEFKTR